MAREIRSEVTIPSSSIVPSHVQGARSGVEAPSVLYVIGTYPLLTTTFIDREILALRGRGVEVDVVSIRRTEHRLSGYQEDLSRGVTYVLPARVHAVLVHNVRYLLRRPAKYLGSMWRLVRGDHPRASQRVRTLGHFFLGVHVAGLVARHSPARVHAHFLDRAATVAIVVSRLLDIPYSATAHANDIYVANTILKQ